MNRADLLAVWQRRLTEAELVDATAPVARIYQVCIDEVRRLDGNANGQHMMSTKDAGKVLGVASRTVARYCKAGRFPGARKTSEDSGDWRIPSDEVYAEIGPNRKEARRG
jgi:hypothetical protein